MIDKKQITVKNLTIVCSALGVLALLFPPSITTFTGYDGVTRVLDVNGPTFIFKLGVGDSIDIVKLIIELIIIVLVYVVSFYLIKNRTQ